MYFTQDGDREIHYLIDRRNVYYFVPALHFPMAGDFTSFHTETIIDGELVLDTVAPGKKVLKYLVFDCLMIDRKSVMDRTLDKRLAVRSPSLAGEEEEGEEGVIEWARVRGVLIRIVLQRIRLCSLPGAVSDLPGGNEVLSIPVSPSPLLPQRCLWLNPPPPPTGWS